MKKEEYGSDTKKLKERATDFGNEINMQTENEKKMLEEKAVEGLLESMKEKKQVRSHLRRDLERFDRDEIKKVTREILKEQAKKVNDKDDSTV